MKTHTREKPFKCTLCYKSFSTAGYVKTHNLIHTGELPFNCSHCDMNFSKSNNLKLHLKSHIDGIDNFLKEPSLKQEAIYIKAEESVRSGEKVNLDKYREDGEVRGELEEGELVINNQEKKPIYLDPLL